MSVQRRTGVLGGRFDPIHLGHMATATVARQILGLDQVLMLPSRVAPHRAAPARTSDADRFAMVTLAASGHPHLRPCDMELSADERSYTAVTLRRLRARGHLRTHLFFIVGADAFADIATWHDYPNVLDGAHFVVISRPGHPVAALVNALPALRARIQLIARGTERRHLDAHAAPAVFLIDALTPDVSSTDIRVRLARGESVAGFVPAAVSAYIERHRLYGLHGQQLA